jgi:hypothetical protein
VFASVRKWRQQLAKYATIKVELPAPKDQRSLSCDCFAYRELQFSATTVARINAGMVPHIGRMTGLTSRGDGITEADVNLHEQRAINQHHRIP